MMVSSNLSIFTKLTIFMKHPKSDHFSPAPCVHPGLSHHHDSLGLLHNFPKDLNISILPPYVCSQQSSKNGPFKKLSQTMPLFCTEYSQVPSFQSNLNSLKWPMRHRIWPILHLPPHLLYYSILCTYHPVSDSQIRVYPLESNMNNAVPQVL